MEKSELSGSYCESSSGYNSPTFSSLNCINEDSNSCSSDIVKDSLADSNKPFIKKLIITITMKKVEETKVFQIKIFSARTFSRFLNLWLIWIVTLFCPVGKGTDIFYADYQRGFWHVSWFGNSLKKAIFLLSLRAIKKLKTQSIFLYDFVKNEVMIYFRGIVRLWFCLEFSLIWGNWWGICGRALGLFIWFIVPFPIKFW